MNAPRGLAQPRPPSGPRPWDIYEDLESVTNAPSVERRAKKKKKSEALASDASRLSGQKYKPAHVAGHSPRVRACLPPCTTPAACVVT